MLPSLLLHNLGLAPLKRGKEGDSTLTVFCYSRGSALHVSYSVSRLERDDDAVSVFGSFVFLWMGSAVVLPYLAPGLVKEAFFSFSGSSFGSLTTSSCSVTSTAAPLPRHS